MQLYCSQEVTSGRYALSTSAQSVWRSCSLPRHKRSLKVKKKQTQMRGRDATHFFVTFLISPQVSRLRFVAHTGKKELSSRVHRCFECGYITDRDVAAAMVVEQRGLASVGQIVKLRRFAGGSFPPQHSAPVEEDCLGVPVKQESLKSDQRCAHAITVLRLALGECHEYWLCPPY